MKIILGKSCRKNQSSYLMYNILFYKNGAVCEIIWKKYGTATQATDDSLIRLRKNVLWMPDNYGKNTHTYSI